MLVCFLTSIFLLCSGFLFNEVTTSGVVRAQEIIDDGSAARHIFASSRTAYVSSFVIPFSGEYVANKLGEMYEQNTPSLDSGQDIYYNSIGAETGSKVGTLFGLVIWFFVIIIGYQLNRFWRT